MIAPQHVSATDPLKPDLIFSCPLQFPLAVATNPNTVHIPFNMIGRLIAVDARVDTVAGTFILDTGAERLLLNKNYFDGFRGAGDWVAMGNTGEVENVRHKKVDSLFWDNLLFADVKANVLDLSHIEQKKKIRLVGIIGYDVFKDFEVFLDFQLMQIVLSKLDKAGNRIDKEVFLEQPYDSLDFRLYRHLIIIKAEIEGVSLKFSLDSGAELNLLDRRVKRKVLNHFEIVKRVNMLGMGQKTIEVLAGVLNDVKCGNQESEGMRTLLTNLSEMNTSFQVNIDGVLGYEFLVTRRTLINYKQKKMFFFKEIRP
ncbi:MAG: hypothetical protein DHS20C18_17300 [Saprospiraceae bacterium]|nr:MAG: hypothetical protein DHS20C18_17300 [Saprospiraceae bacterium]